MEAGGAGAVISCKSNPAMTEHSGSIKGTHARDFIVRFSQFFGIIQY
jgi:hypothetical protein